MTPISVGDEVRPGEHDLLYIGGGQDREQALIAPDLVAKGPAIEDGRRGRRSAARRLRRLPAPRPRLPAAATATRCPASASSRTRPFAGEQRMIGDVLLECELVPGRAADDRRLREPRRPDAARSRRGAARPRRRRLRERRRVGLRGRPRRPRDRHLPARAAAAAQSLARRLAALAGAGARDGRRAAGARAAAGPARGRGARGVGAAGARPRRPLLTCPRTARSIDPSGPVPGGVSARLGRRSAIVSCSPRDREGVASRPVKHVKLMLAPSLAIAACDRRRGRRGPVVRREPITKQNGSQAGVRCGARPICGRSQACATYERSAEATRPAFVRRSSRHGAMPVQSKRQGRYILDRVLLRARDRHVAEL